MVTVRGIVEFPPPGVTTGAAGCSTYCRSTMVLVSAPVFQALTLSVKLRSTVMVPPDATLLLASVGSLPSVV